MNKRTIAIVRRLNQEGDPGSLSDLAKEFGVSERTIRNDIHSINEILDENGYNELTFGSHGKIERRPDFALASSLFTEEDFYNYKLSKSERKKVAAALIVNATGFVTLADLADQLFVSRATVISDLDDIKAYITKHGMTVDSHPNKGLRVLGKESDKRQFLLHVIMPDIGTLKENMLSRYISVQAGDRVVIQKIVEEQEHTYRSHLTDVSFQRLIMYLGIMVNRNMQGEYMEVREEKEFHHYRMAQDILKYVSQYCHIRTTEDEVRYLSEFLTNCRYMKTDNYAGDIVQIQMFTRLFIEKLSDILGVNLNQDYDFFENLSNHFNSVFSAEPAVYPKNESIDNALEENSAVMNAVYELKDLLTDYAGRELTEDELKYIGIHICAALERQKQKEVSFHVILACHAGIGTSQLLLTKLKEHFNFQIVDIISAHEAEKLQEGAADFIISTVDLKNCKLDYVVVSPMLNDEDYIRVGSKIDALRSSRNLPSRISTEKSSPKELMEKISPILYEVAPEEAHELEKRIRKEVSHFFSEPYEETDLFAPTLHHLLPPSHIQLDVECSDWKDAVRKSAENLVERGYVEERYIDAMITNIEENGPYIVLSKGFAVPHEGVEKGSIKAGMNLIRLKHPVNFGDEDLDPVWFVCTLSAVDHKTHLKAFFNLVNLLRQDEFKDKLMKAATPEEAASIIEKYEYSLDE
ncbi:MAG: PTS sugar transporter subunit IIA [Eubacteriales bacterium]|jgi:mannitol operon transcriptional antiterminator